MSHILLIQRLGSHIFTITTLEFFIYYFNHQHLPFNANRRNTQTTDRPQKSHRCPRGVLQWSPNLQVAFPIPKIYQGYTKDR